MAAKSPLFTYVAAGSANLMTFGVGMGYGWSSPSLPKLNGQVDPQSIPLSIPTTVLQDSWIASLLSLGAMCSPFITVFLSEIIGRKKTLLAFSFPMIVSHLIMIFATKVVDFYIARFMIGISSGCMFSLIPVYTAEISQKHNRGLVGITLNIMLTLGHLTSSVVGPYVTIKMLSVVSLVPCVLFVVSFATLIPETPYFYVLVGKKQEAEVSLKKLRRSSAVEDELAEIVKSVEDLKLTERGNFGELFTRKHHLKALFWAVGIMFFQQFTGIIYVVSYTQKIFDAAHTSLSADLEVMIVTAVQVIAVLLSTQAIDRVARKTLMAASLVLMLLPNFFMGLYFYLLEFGYNLDPISWLPVALLVIFISGFNVGIGPLGFTFAGEIFEPGVKCWGVTLATCTNLMVAFLTATFMPSVSEISGFYAPFWIFAGFTAVGIVFVYVFVPETKGKSFLEIQRSVRSEK
ncbi:facilitated trehalose transporter Tret1-2 homolog [Cylas formicarius]|uniref:facilitated trehalose transporter Tret1-2 homolog n=1 Tax=Cylas formicarius TaxID=197179 RepID=UPI00295885C3|nr:facilitated trehalose transporter Tret1-2 homolog [Cylas formicarius]